MSGADLIAAERQRQIDVEGWAPEHDDEYEHSQLATAAVSYISHTIYRRDVSEHPDDWWPWWGGIAGAERAVGWKPSDDPIRNLVKAGALIAAEIDRLQRLQSFDGVAVSGGGETPDTHNPPGVGEHRRTTT